MKARMGEINLAVLPTALKTALADKNRRLGLFTSIDGSQLLTCLLNTQKASAECWLARLDSYEYPSLTLSIPQVHWFERALADLFALKPIGHPRLKPLFMHECYDLEFAPLQRMCDRKSGHVRQARDFTFMTVAGEGVYEVPVGPVHAGIIEPGHFRLSCLGETMLNLELRLGFLHRGVEQRLTGVPWTQARFVCEAAASDTAAANALAHAIAMESLLDSEVPPRSQHLRSIALEIERIAMHIFDVGGMAHDLGFLAIAATLSRLRGTALRMGELLSNSRFMRAFIRPGGVSLDPDAQRLKELGEIAGNLRRELKLPLHALEDNQAVFDRLHGTGKLKPDLARDFGLVGVAGRACGIAYDTRNHFAQGAFPTIPVSVPTETEGDALARVRVRIREVDASFDLIDELLKSMPEGPVSSTIPKSLPENQVAVSAVEAFRGELVHLVMTDGAGNIKRYAIKDPSFNNWTGLAIAARNNVLADFPVCNKSFGLSYSGHDL